MEGEGEGEEEREQKEGKEEQETWGVMVTESKLTAVMPTSMVPFLVRLRV